MGRPTYPTAYSVGVAMTAAVARSAGCWRRRTDHPSNTDCLNFIGAAVIQRIHRVSQCTARVRKQMADGVQSKPSAKRPKRFGRRRRPCGRAPWQTTEATRSSRSKARGLEGLVSGQARVAQLASSAKRGVVPAVARDRPDSANVGQTISDGRVGADEHRTAEA